MSKKGLERGEVLKKRRRGREKASNKRGLERGKKVSKKGA